MFILQEEGTPLSLCPFLLFPNNTICALFHVNALHCKVMTIYQMKELWSTDSFKHLRDFYCFIYTYMHANSLQQCPTLCDPMEHNLPGSPVRWILQGRILEWVAISSSRSSSWPRDGSHSLLHWQAGSFINSTTWKPYFIHKNSQFYLNRY